MGEVLSSVWWLIVALGVLVTFHEFGHFWVARRLGVKVLTFSVGFGRALWSRTAKDGVRYVIAWLPLGGYVKLLDSREREVTDAERPLAMDYRPPWQKISILLAGPVFNLIFAVLAFWVMFMVGIQQARPLVGEVSGLAAEAGLPPMSEIVEVDGEQTGSWQHAHLALMTRALDREPARVVVESESGARSEHVLDLKRLPADFSEENTLAAIGIDPWRPSVPATIGSINEDGPAQRAGLRAGDTIVRIGGEPVEDWAGIGPLVQQLGHAGEPLSVTVLRDGYEVELSVRPTLERSGLSGERLIVGIVNAPPSEELMAAWTRSRTVVRYGPIEGLPKAVGEMWRLTTTTLGLLGRMITGKASVKNLSGPISIAQFANDSASLGLSSFLFFLGLISLSLGILNLLPIPLLDGGHIVFYLIEWVKGSPVPERVQVAGQYFGLMALAALMGLAFVNDILRLFG